MGSICNIWKKNDRLFATHFLIKSRCMPQTTSASVQGSPSILPPWIWQKKERLKPDQNCLLSWMIRKSSMFRWGLFLETDYILIRPIWRKLWFCVHIPLHGEEISQQKLQMFLGRECKSLMLFCYQNCCSDREAEDLETCKKS